MLRFYMKSCQPELSIIIPMRNEEGNAVPLFEEIRGVFGKPGIPWEAVFVDDASTDGTLGELKNLASQDPRVGVLILPTHQGKSAALAAGVSVARGGFWGMMDGDLQNCPADLLRMVEVLKSDPSVDFIQGMRRMRKDSFSKRVASRVGLYARRMVLGDSCPDSGCGLRAMRSKAGEQLPLHFEGMHRLLPYLCRVHGGKVLDMSVEHRPRHAGSSKYHVGPISRGLCGFLDLLAARWMKWRLRCDTHRKFLGPGES